MLSHTKMRRPVAPGGCLLLPPLPKQAGVVHSPSRCGWRETVQ